MRSNSFGESYSIRGATLADAIVGDFATLVDRSLPASRSMRPVRATALWMSGVMGGMGGVALTIEAVPLEGGDSEDFVTLVEAVRDDMRHPVEILPE